MKSAIFLIFSIFMLIWLIFTGFVLGIIPIDAISHLAKPLTLAELGDSYAVINGLLLSVAIALGLIAVFNQGESLKKSIKLQNEQTAALTFQITQQNHSNRLSALTAQLRYYQTGSDRLDQDINLLNEKLEQAKRDKNELKERDLLPLIKQARDTRANNDVTTRRLNKQITAIVEFEPSKKKT
ncbi:MAG: hypothetical protein ISEC1_P1038 [Thiomicrorhabdus sp.]|nr:MAG: hypothetical protein ISEC1_P1038 [Thiomicrorhabdus sp.]